MTIKSVNICIHYFQGSRVYACIVNRFPWGDRYIYPYLLQYVCKVTKMIEIYNVPDGSELLYKLRSVQNTGTCHQGQGWFVRVWDEAARRT